MNTAASIRARLLNASKKSGEVFQSLLVRYAIERFLFRLGKSAHRDAFLLKGAMRFVAWGGRPHRPTKDLDLLGFGEPGQEDVARRIADIAAVSNEDGMEFDINSIETELIKEDAEYEGVPVHLTARLEQARIPLQIDIGFGDAVTPEPIAIDFPTILDRVQAPALRIYPAEVVIAEKLHAMVVLDIRNSRMKDFYDIWFLARTQSFDLAALIVAITATFERRRTRIRKSRHSRRRLPPRRSQKAFAVGARTGVRRTLTPSLVTALSSSWDAVPVVEHEPVRMIARQGLPELLQGPLRCRMGGHVVMENAARSHFHHYEDVEGEKSGRGDDEEVAGYDHLG